MVDLQHGAVATSVRHESAHLHVTGEAVYTDDIAAPRGTLSAAIGYAPAAHGGAWPRPALVRAAPGVVAVLTATDIPAVNNYGGIKLDDPILATELIEYHGQPVFLVVADSHLNAQSHAPRQVGSGRANTDPQH